MTPNADVAAAATLDAPAAPSDRLSELRTAVARLRIGAARGDHSSTLMVVGGVIAPLGLLAVILGWFGASHTPNSFEQVPYLISGGLLGLGLVFLGGFLYFTHWVTVLIREGRAQSDRAAEALERIEHLLATAATAGTPFASGTRTGAETAPLSVPERDAGVDEPLYATPNGTMLHRRDCPVIANRDNARRVTADEPGFTACRICNPL
jgi:hypothetical protein